MRCTFGYGDISEDGQNTLPLGMGSVKIVICLCFKKANRYMLIVEHVDKVLYPHG